MIFRLFISLMQSTTSTAVFTKKWWWWFMLEENDQCYWGNGTAQEKLLPPFVHRHEKSGIPGLFPLKRFHVLPWAYAIPYQNGTKPQIWISLFQAFVFTALIIVFINLYKIFKFICRLFWMYMQWMGEYPFETV